MTKLPRYHESYTRVDQILSLDQLYWGLYRVYTDSLLYFGSIQNAYRELRVKDLTSLTTFFRARRHDTEVMIHRGAPLAVEHIAQDDRYLIAEQACKSFEPSEPEGSLLMVLKGAWIDHVQKGGGKVSARQLLEGSFVLSSFGDRQGQFMFAADEILDSTVTSEQELIDRYEAVAHAFAGARKKALRNTELYLSMANDLDVYVATIQPRIIKGTYCGILVSEGLWCHACCGYIQAHISG